MPWQILILDDRVRFALHVWRYLTRSIGLGDQENAWSEMSPRWSDDGELCFQWIKATTGYLEQLGTALKKVKEGEGVYVVVDVHGESGSRYSHIEVIELLQKQVTRLGPDNVHWRLVSAYHFGVESASTEIWPKSRSTLQAIKADLGKLSGRSLGSTAEHKNADPQAFHVLVTGAGFEMSDGLGGFGIPSTSELLMRMRCTAEEGDEADALVFQNAANLPKGSFPIPRGGIWSRRSSHTRTLAYAAKKKDLDLYWNILLEQELRDRLGFEAILDEPVRERAGRKSDAQSNERRLRESFRRSILEHDWGHMNQSIEAAGLAWHAWLTTNYTQFANRAISLRDDNGSWRIVATASEAGLAMREDVRKRSGIRYLFKLHGDIGHLHTMAIAGHDKDPYSPLGVPVESLFQIYRAAERFLKESPIEAETGRRRVVWHIVGHGLRDYRLLELIERTCEQVDTEHTIVIVNPLPGEVMKQIEEGELAHLQKRVKVLCARMKGCEYMVRLAARGFDSLLDREGETGLPRPWPELEHVPWSKREASPV